MKKQGIKILIALLLFLVSFVIPTAYRKIQYVLYILSYGIVGWEIVVKAIRNLFRGKVMDENFLMAIATLGAFGIGEFPEAVAVMLFYQIGEWFQNYAVNQSRKSIASLMDIRADFANVKRGKDIIKVDPEKVTIGESIVVKPGEKIPLDGIVTEGSSFLDTSSLTGESVPRKVTIGEEVLSGCVNQQGVLTIKVTKPFGESTVSKILDLVENASSKKSKSEHFISKFARYYTPAVVVIAILLAVLPPILLEGNTFVDWFYRALTFLVVSCPCALVISIPLGFFGGIGGASKSGILVKGSNFLEALANTEMVVLDKTGTLTKGTFEVQNIVTKGMENGALLYFVAHAESYSSHPIAISVKKAYGKAINDSLVEGVKELPGLGVSARVEGKEVLVGNDNLMKENAITYLPCEEIGTILYVAIEKEYVGYLVIADEIKEDAKQAIQQLNAQHIKQVVMLTGDKKEVAEKIADKLGIKQVYSELLPNQKAEILETLMKDKQPKGKVVFVGDGMNDAPVLAMADIGIAMGGLGSDAAIEASDVVIMTDEPSKIEKVIRIAKQTMRIVKQNIVFAITIKIAVLLLTALGLSTMWEAVFADVGVSVLAILNALRVLKKK